MALYRCGASADSFKKWCIIGADYASPTYISYTYENTENSVQHTEYADITSTPFSDSDVISVSVSGTDYTITAKIDCKIKFTNNNYTGNYVQNMTANSTITLSVNRLALYAVAK